MIKELKIVQNAWEKVAERLDCVENGNFIRKSSKSMKIAVLKKSLPCSVSEILTKY